MAVKLHQRNFFCTRSSSSLVTHKSVRLFSKEVDTSHILHNLGSSKQKLCLRLTLSRTAKENPCCRWVELGRCSPTFGKFRKKSPLSLSASTDDNIVAYATGQTSSNNDLEELRAKLNQSLQGEDAGNGLIQSLHDAARVFELAIKEHSSFSKLSWFSKAWLGVDRNAWLKTLSYQAAVYTILQAAIEVASRGDGRDRDVNVFVQRSLSRQSAPLKELIRVELSAKQPEVYEWFWSQQIPMVVTTFVNYLENDTRFITATTVCQKGASGGPGNATDQSLLMLALSCMGSIVKLGPAKISCSDFFSMIPETTGRLMDKLVDFVPIPKAYYSLKDIGLRREFLDHFGPRAATARTKNVYDTEEIVFWVDFVQRQLRRAIDREKIWSRLTTSESIEVLEKDLAIFGFFIALGRSSKTYLCRNGFSVIDEPLDGFLRYLIGGSVLYYPQLSSISSYQLYVEVVCEELEWLPFYEFSSEMLKRPQESKGKLEGLPNREAISQVLNVCLHWMQSFIKYSKWLENPANIKAARFLSRGHNKLRECIQEFGLLMTENNADLVRYPRENSAAGTCPPVGGELDAFDKALESVEEAVKRLEELLQEIHVSSSNPGKEHLKAACSDLERIRKLKKEAEFLEASFRAKAASLEQENDIVDSQKSNVKEERHHSTRKVRKGFNMFPGSNNGGQLTDRLVHNSKGLWGLLVHNSTKKVGVGGTPSGDDENAGELSTQATDALDDTKSKSDEILRFEILRNELIELEKRVQRSTDGTYAVEDVNSITRPSGDLHLECELGEAEYGAAAQGNSITVMQKKENIIVKSLDKLKETGTDVLQGTQLLAIDVLAAMGLLKRAVIGDELTEKEKNALRRTLTDLASVVPIGILMLLPVTAVGHAAILAAIQRYVPALIPSTYAPDRLDLLRQLEKVKEMETGENPDESTEPHQATFSNMD